MKFLKCLLFLGLGVTGLAQDDYTTIYGSYSFSSNSNAGIMAEFGGLRDRSESMLTGIYMTQMDYKVSGFETSGSGFVFDFGSRKYLKKDTTDGMYYANYLSYGHIYFDEDEFDGEYSYFSFFSPEYGYKWRLKNNFVIEPFVNAMWKLEIKGKGMIDNKNVDEWAFRAGLRLGYQF